jgi:glycosyltransferase involved in cell wall biosynthesis/SAM-dependent methyltransferase
LAERAHPNDPGFQGTVDELRMHERYEFASRFVQSKDVLDVGCGIGWGWPDLARPRSVTGIDVSLEALAEGRRLGYITRAAAADMEQLPFPDATFDAVTCLEAIEHIPARAAHAFLQECIRVLRPGGILVLSAALRRNGLHSGNAWHFVEYTEEEIRSLVDPSFDCLDARVDAGGDPPVFLYAGAVRQEHACRPRIHWSESGIHARCEAWLESTSTPTGFRFTTGGFETVTSTCMGVLIAEGLGLQLPNRDSIVSSILEAQDQATGRFLEPLAGSIPPAGELHDRIYLDSKTTYYALHALDALGAQPRYPLQFLEEYSRKERIIQWLSDLDWGNPWRESNLVMHMLSALLFSLRWEGNLWAAERYHDVLDWLDARQDPRTGLWGTERGASLLNAVAGAYHFIPFYRYARRPVRGWSKIVDACLELQNGDGLFAPYAGGGACEDADAIDLLCTAVRVTGQLRSDVRQALARAFWAIWNMQRPDGSFPYSNVEDESSYCYSSWPAMEARIGGGDLWATWFRLCALHTIHALLGEDLPDPGRWTFRRMPGLGFHLQDAAILPDAPPEHRPIWFRPLPARLEPTEPRVSVVVTCYNLGQYLHESLSSVCNQTLEEIETVIVDDGSTDPYTIARLDDLAKSGWRVLRTENRGLPAARNLGIQNTRAPYICCLDADDRLRPEYLEKAAAALEANPRAGFVSCFYDLFDEASGACRYPRPQLPRMLARNEAVVSSVFRRDAWAETGGYCQSLPAMQDWDFWISILEKGWEAEQLMEPLFDYRIRAGSMYSETKKPHRYSRILSLIHARHSDLYQKHLAEVLRLQARFFAENVEFASRQEASWSQAMRQLRQELNRRSLAAPAAEPATEAVSPEPGQPAEEPAPAETEPPSPDASKEPAPPPAPEASADASVHSPSWIRTILWALPQVLHPRAGWRGARNLVFYVRLLQSRRARALWDSLFDPSSYAAVRPDVAEARLHPDVHYALAGAWEDTDPSPAFSTAFYLKRHADVAARGINPLLHYALFGVAEGRIFASQSASFAEAPAFSGEIRQSGGPLCEPLVSVVIPCFNYGRYLEEALHSVLRQTFSNLEILVIEGGSTDSATAALVRRLERANLPRVRFFYRDSPCLAGDNRNYGIARARGRYVCCLDADDQLDPVYLEAAVFFAELGDYDFVYPSLQSFGEDALEWLVDDPRWPNILQENQVTTVALFRRTIWETLGGYRDWGKGSTHLPEDWDFWIRAVGAGFRGAAMRARMMRYRVQSSSLSRHRTSSYSEWARRLAQENHSLAALERPPARPLPEVPRVSWTSLEDPSTQPAVLMALPFFTEGGAEKIFLALARRWRAQGAKVVVVTTLELSPASPDRLDVLRRVTPYVFDLPRILWNREELRADFIYYLLRRHHVSLIYFAGCDLMYQLLPQVRQEFPQIAVVDQLFNDEVHFHTNRATARWIDCTIVPGERIGRRLREEFGEPEERVAVIPHGVRLPEGGCPASPALPPGFENRPLVGFFGRLSPEKAPLDFIRIAAAVHEKAPETRFIMTGEGPEQEAVEKEIRRRRLTRVVFTPGFVPDVRPWIAACDVAVVPSRLDGMPLIVFEAQSFGRCVVASRVGSIPEVICDGETGLLCEPGDIEGFAAAILSLIASPETRRRIGEAARRRVFEEYSQQVMLDRYFRLFDSLLARRREGQS